MNTPPTTPSADIPSVDIPLASIPSADIPTDTLPIAEIMVVDDTPANLHLFIKLLTSQGYRIFPITEGAQALAAAQASPPDVILLDIQMPGMDGYEVCRQLKADTRTCHIPVIFLTVLDDENSIIKGFELGGIDYVTKPVRERELLARVKNQIELRSLQKRLREKNKQQKANQKKLIAQTQILSQTLQTLQTTQSELIRAAKMAALGNLVAGVAHEISTPVGTALMTASTLENATETISANLEQGKLKRSSFENYLGIAAECSHLILSNLHRAGELINGFKQVAVDQTSLQKRVFLIKPYIQEVVSNLSPQFKKTPHQTVVIGDDTLLVESYPGSLAQVITNLTTNALTHAYPNDQPGTISITIAVQNNNIVLTYHDDGCGISAEHQNRIFEPFFTTTRDIGGSGLGLHLVYNIVTQTLKGKIEVASQPQEGTTFTITFPYG